MRLYCRQKGSRCSGDDEYLVRKVFSFSGALLTLVDCWFVLATEICSPLQILRGRLLKSASNYLTVLPRRGVALNT